MSVYTAYYDAAGKQSQPDSTFLTVVGLLATETQWRSFCKAWSKALKELDLPYMHATEFSSGDHPFERWKGRRELREDALWKLIRVVMPRVTRCCSLTVNLGLCKKLASEYNVIDIAGGGHSDAGAFSLCAAIARGSVCRWLEQNHPSDPVMHVFERGDLGWGALLRGSEAVPGLVETTTDLAKKKNPCSEEYWDFFQATDMIAWMLNRASFEKHNNGHNRAYHALDYLLKRKNGDLGFHYEKTLTDMCENVPYIKKKSKP